MGDPYKAGDRVRAHFPSGGHHDMVLSERGAEDMNRCGNPLYPWTVS